MANILIVDDVGADRQILATILGAQGHRLREAANGRDALALIRAEPPDLVITDLLMPRMDGFDLIRCLRLDAATALTPVVLHSARYAEHEATAVAASTGASYVLTKPAGSAEVLRVINRALSRVPDPPPPESQGRQTP